MKSRAGAGKAVIAARSPQTLRRSFALPRQLVDSARELSEPELRNNLNRLVTTALDEYVARRKRARFQAEMIRMASDPEIRREVSQIERDFSGTEMDGLEADEW